MRPKLTATLMFFVVIVFGALGTRLYIASGQQQNLPQTNRKPACGCYVCGLLLAVEFPNKDRDCYGILASDACGTELKNMPEARRKAACEALVAKSKDKLLSSCPALAEACKSDDGPPRTNCDKPTPWFSTPPSACKDLQGWIVAVSDRTVTLSVCGTPVFSRVLDRSVDPDTYRTEMSARVRTTAGTYVCCDKFREAARTGRPCDPSADVDCDGRPNQQDVLRDLVTEQNASLFSTPVYPSVNRVFTRAEGASIDPFPPGLNPDDTDFFPSQDKCDCKWELVNGTLSCSPDGKQPHVYQARWRCPSTGNERFTRKEAKATAPCEKPERTEGQ